MDAFDKRKLVLDQLRWLAVYIGSAFVISILLLVCQSSLEYTV